MPCLLRRLSLLLPAAALPLVALASPALAHVDPAPLLESPQFIVLVLDNVGDALPSRS
ncbi:hypothetical protein [Nonomuraea sp. NPDC050643]|uniref:hypothetical protein n=1 Tax=Nonomuraea sp. NPDC050643 TaxID=3155660 RepID=UPI0033FC0B15